MMNIRSYKKMMRELAVGETFYFNAINGTVSMVEYTRELIKAGKIRPEQTELDKAVKAEYQDRFLSGESIMPQMTYVVIA